MIFFWRRKKDADTLDQKKNVIEKTDHKPVLLREQLPKQEKTRKLNETKIHINRIFFQNEKNWKKYNKQHKHSNSCSGIKKKSK